MASREESACKLKQALEAIPGAKESFLRVLRDPETAKGAAAGVGRLMEVIKRGPQVGWLVAVAEVEDKDARMAIAKALQEAMAEGRKLMVDKARSAR